MFALVESGSITKMLKGNQALKLGDLQYPAAIFTLWTEAERNAIGVYTIEVDETNKKDEDWYINTNISYAFSGGKVKGTYGTATAKNIEDTLYTNTDKSNGVIPTGKDVGDVKTEGLKTVKKIKVDEACNSELLASDYMALKAAEGVAMDSGWKTWRASVRTKCNEMQTAIDNAADVDALAALYVRNAEGVRPLGDFPVKE